MIRDAGATEVHLLITCPPITHACHFGVDMGHDDDLMAARLNVDEMREHIGADSLGFLSLDGMMRAIAGDELPDRGQPGPAQARLRRGAGLMRVLVVGSGGREAAIEWACRQHGHEVTTEAAFDAARHGDVDLVIVGPESALVAGTADACAAAGVPCFGPTASLVRLESSKGYTRALAQQLGLPSPRFYRSDDHHDAIKWWRSLEAPVVVKLDGLAAGKGVIVPDTPAETDDAI
eukprot:gene30287-52398_t